jgi:hypothetical protein
MMTLDEFKSLIDIYSADLSRWPREKLQEAVALMKANAQAAAALEEQVWLDDALRQAEIALPDVRALEARIMQAVADMPAAQSATDPALPPAWTIFGWRPAYIFAPSGGLMAMALLGFMIGAQPVSQQKEILLDPVYYSADQLMSSDADIYDGGIF